MDPVRFRGHVRRWNAEKASGLAVVDIPEPAIATLGGLRQMRVRGRAGGVAFVSSVMPAGGGRLALSMSKAMMQAASIDVGDAVEIEITGVGKETNGG